MSKKVLFCLLALSTAMFSSPALLPAEEKVFVNGIDPNYPPFAYLDKDRNPDGFDVKAVDWISKEMGFTVKHEPIDWDSVIACLNEKEIDLIASGIPITAKMKAQVRFTIPYWTVRKVIVATTNSPLTVEQILTKGKRVAVLRGTDEADWIEENLIEKEGKGFSIVYYDSAPVAVEDLMLGRVAGAAMSDAPAMDAVKNRSVKIVGPFGMPDEHFAYAVRKEDTAFLDVLNEGLRRLMASPYWKELQKKYME